MPKEGKQTVDHLRKEIARHMKELYHGGELVMGMYQQPPPRWPKGLPFGNPFNSKHLRKDHLLKMRNFLCSQIKQKPESERDVHIPYDDTQVPQTPECHHNALHSSSVSASYPIHPRPESGLPATDVNEISMDEAVHHDHSYTAKLQEDALDDAEMQEKCAKLDVALLNSHLEMASTIPLSLLEHNDVEQVLGDLNALEDIKARPPEVQVPCATPNREINLKINKNVTQCVNLPDSTAIHSLTLDQHDTGQMYVTRGLRTLSSIYLNTAGQQ